ncbi:TRAP transporter small permease [Tropicimonas sp. IMCC6043]|uniref:TRAP transporter small permease n=1 Tax=Tropicimonas sp. IMCC6043 TaxID=2510645 RepID=UPI00101DADA6|nr:TRAP transporter small permease subunit [Tropicimonas sp. IMCC6043]RYH12014.1 TRAP transporter small permease subunit [Tropicimonas sp. IMCC6043]
MLDFVEKALLRLIEGISLALLVTLALAVLYSTTMRYLGASPSWYDEIASVLLAWLTYFGASYAVFMRQHMGFSGLVVALPRGFAIGLALFAELLVIAYFAITGWFGYKVLEVAAWDSLLSLPSVSLDIVQSVIPITAALMIAGTLLTMPRVLRYAAEGVDREHVEIEQAIADAEAGKDAHSKREGRP